MNVHAPTVRERGLWNFTNSSKYGPVNCDQTSSDGSAKYTELCEEKMVCKN